MENQDQIFNTTNNQEAAIDLTELHNILENLEPQTSEQFEMKAVLERAKNILIRSH